MISPHSHSCEVEDWLITRAGAENDFGGGVLNVTQTGNMTSVPYAYAQVLTPLDQVEAVVLAGAGVGKISV